MSGLLKLQQCNKAELTIIYFVSATMDPRLLSLEGKCEFFSGELVLAQITPLLCPLETAALASLYS